MPIRKPQEIADLLVKICKENDDRVMQAIQNAMWAKTGNNDGGDFFGLEDSELLRYLQRYYKSSKSGNDKVKAKAQ